MGKGVSSFRSTKALLMNWRQLTVSILNALLKEGNISPKHKYLRVIAKRMGPGSFQWQDKGQWAEIDAQDVLSEYEEKLVYCEGCRALPRESWSLFPWRYSNPAWTQSCATCSGWTCSSRELDQIISRGPFQPQAVQDPVKHKCSSRSVQGPNQPFPWQNALLHTTLWPTEPLHGRSQEKTVIWNGISCLWNILLYQLLC